MTESATASHTRSFVTDTLIGLGLFGLTVTMTAGTGTFAATFSAPDSENINIALANASGGEGSIVVLGIVFSVLFALNASFFRHLSRAYIGASARRRR